jgi:hypothetical protein
MLDQHIVNLPRVPFGRVRAGDDLGARSLILTLDTFLLKTFRGFFVGGGGVATTLHLPAQVLEDPTLRPINESLVDSAHRVRAEIETAWIGVSS